MSIIKYKKDNAVKLTDSTTPGIKGRISFEDGGIVKYQNNLKNLLSSPDLKRVLLDYNRRK